VIPFYYSSGSGTVINYGSGSAKDKTKFWFRFRYGKTTSILIELVFLPHLLPIIFFSRQDGPDAQRGPIQTGLGGPGQRWPPTHGRPGVERRDVGPLGRRSRAGAKRTRPEPGATGPEPRAG
jgi:hypothetical protein